MMDECAEKEKHATRLLKETESRANISLDKLTEMTEEMRKTKEQLEDADIERYKEKKDFEIVKIEFEGKVSTLQLSISKNQELWNHQKQFLENEM